MAEKPVQEDSRASSTSIPVKNKGKPLSQDMKAAWEELQKKKAALRELEEKKPAMRELPDNTKAAETPVQSKDKVSTSDSSAIKIAGSKRSNPCSPASPLTYTYVRRKLDTEQGKANGSPIIKEEATKEKTVKHLQEFQVMQNIQQSQQSQNSHDSQHLQNIYKGEVSKAATPENGSQPDVSTAMKLQSGSHEEMRRASKLQNEEVSEVTDEQKGSKSNTREAMKPQNGIKEEPSEITKLVTSSLTASQDWKERFVRLQAFLKNCDQSNQEDYMRMLRSLTAVGRSKHAIELEKRAIHLLLEEGKELHRMKVLNVLGKGSPSDPSSYLPQLSSPPSHPQLQR